MLKRLYRSRELRRWALIVYWIVMFSATHWPDLGRYLPDMGPFDFIDSVVHSAIYAGWVGMWWWFLSVGDRRVSRAAIGWLLVGGVIWAGFDEWSQAIVARTPDIVDFLCDLFGICVAVIILRLWQHSWSVRQPMP